MRYKLLIIGIFLLAAFFRLYGVNWDQNQHLHPDERFLTMVATGISWPKGLAEYFDTQTSPLNPHNRGFGFFVYGTFPIFFTKWVAEILGQADYTNLTIVGRQLSAMADLGTVLLVFLIGQQIIRQPQKKKSYLSVPLWGMFLYSVMVLPIQLSHFYAVDTYLTFFITLSFFLIIKLIQNRKSTTILYSNAVLLGIAFGLALASKISAVLFLPIIGLGLLFNLIKTKNFSAFFVSCLLFFVSCFITFRLTQPYAFASGNILNPTPNPKLIENWKQLESFDNPNTAFPPALQWIPTKPYIYPLEHLIIWGLGPIMGIISILAITHQLCLHIIYFIKKKFKPFEDNNQIIIFLFWAWITIVFGYQGGQFAKALRYLYPMLPFVALISGIFISEAYKLIYQRHKLLGLVFVCIIGLISIIWTQSFVSIYTRPHPRVSASMWIYKNIPSGSTIGNEHWDDPQPLYNTGGNPTDYKGIELTLYYPDSDPNKWKKMADKLERADYIAITSNRLWRSLSTIPEKYPQTARYYKALFDGSLGFEQIAVFSSYPCLLPKNQINQSKSEKTNLHPPPISVTVTSYCYLALNDDGAEESFTVYDHPKVIIFKKTPSFSITKLLNIINGKQE